MFELDIFVIDLFRIKSTEGVYFKITQSYGYGFYMMNNPKFYFNTVSVVQDIWYTYSIKFRGTNGWCI